MSWIQKAKERIAREKELEKKRQEAEAEAEKPTSVDTDVDVPTPVPSILSKATPVLDAKDEARMSIMRDILGDSTKSDKPDLVIPLRDKSTAENASKEGSTAVQNRLPGFNTMVRFWQLSSLPGQKRVFPHGARLEPHPSSLERTARMRSLARARRSGL